MSSQQETQKGLEFLLLWNIINLGLEDVFWTSFQFKERPKHGSFFNRFRSKPIVMEEEFLFKEFILVGLVEASRSIYKNIEPHLSENLVARLLELLVDGLPEDSRPTWQLFHFVSRTESIKYFIDGSLLYLNEEPKNEAHVFVNRFRSLDGDISTPVFLSGVTYMFVQQIPLLRDALDKLIISEPVKQGTQVSDCKFINVVADITRLLS
jgi:hypothetical protein